ncbi:MAG: hypothetical protein ACLQVY_10755 [Limisphaerales bacterium]
MNGQGFGSASRLVRLYSTMLATSHIDAIGARAEIPPEVLFGRKNTVAQQLDRILV